MKKLTLWFALLLPLTLMAQQTLNSGPQKNQLIELYTSEGCSSCPPADQWLSNYKSHPQLWSDIIPVAYHVDYWDYIGWPDRFAAPSYALRQRQHARQGNISQVYTPGFVVNGKEWRGWYRSKNAPAIGDANVGELTITIEQEKFSARFDQPADRLTIAVIGFDLKTPVKAGENKGELLNHDFVVLGVKDYQVSGSAWQGELPPVSAKYQDTPLAIAAWVSDSRSLKPIQVVGGLID
ncbi:DUF1223 domain-containing protein [Oceanicoccus sagamiensis]|uniref:DUF1223 domain-containing protein n=1 Tax=Oceanicoccus sagamiensis TaxID=716816 RepID=A0A1X9NAC6_9GAMM|nr:DUF1223 domain-containing protein [Oceanicoccus sagamiensis]ARN74111.1 hypothetical protein BST96_08235 [Oceanicoccus sagamiensis]